MKGLDHTLEATLCLKLKNPSLGEDFQGSRVSFTNLVSMHSLKGMQTSLVKLGMFNGVMMTMMELGLI